MKISYELDSNEKKLLKLFNRIKVLSAYKNFEGWGQTLTLNTFIEKGLVRYCNAENNGYGPHLSLSSLGLSLLYKVSEHKREIEIKKELAELEEAYKKQDEDFCKNLDALKRMHVNRKNELSKQKADLILELKTFY